MSDHEWCRDVRRDEQVRAAEDAAAVPAIMHRDLPEVVAALTERVARLEAAVRAAGGEQQDEARARDEQELISNVPKIMKVIEARDALAADVQRLTSDLAAERDTVAMLQRRFQRCVDLRDTDTITIADLTAERDAARARVAELEAAAPPRGWLTAEERDAVDHAADIIEDMEDDDGSSLKPKADSLRALLARSTPPRVKVPHRHVIITTVDARERIDRQWIAAIRAAGGEVDG